MNSIIYKYDATQSMNPFQEFQVIPTKGAMDWKYFSINGQHYLVVANHHSGGSWDQNSIVYKYDAARSTDPLQLIESIPTHGAADFEHFAIGDKNFLAVANYQSGDNNNINSIIYDRSTFNLTADSSGNAMATLTIPSAGNVPQEFRAKSCTTMGCGTNLTTSSTKPPCTNAAVEKYDVCWFAPCPAGYYGFAPQCYNMTNATCSPGMEYSSASAQQETSSLIGAQIDDARCDSCVRGSFKPVNGFSACSVCPPGKFTNETGSVDCKFCPAGKTLTTEGSAQYHDSLEDCEDCPVLQFSPFEGHFEECYHCLTAKVTGASTCDGCYPGMFSSFYFPKSRFDRSTHIEILL